MPARQTHLYIHTYGFKKISAFKINNLQIKYFLSYPYTLQYMRSASFSCSAMVHVTKYFSIFQYINFAKSIEKCQKENILYFSTILLYISYIVGIQTYKLYLSINDFFKNYKYLLYFIPSFRGPGREG